MTKQNINTVKVTEQNLLGMVKGLREWRFLLVPIIAEQPDFQQLADIGIIVEADLLAMNKILHRKYDGMSKERYSIEIDALVGIDSDLSNLS